MRCNDNTDFELYNWKRSATPWNRWFEGLVVINEYEAEAFVFCEKSMTRITTYI